MPKRRIYKDYTMKPGKVNVIRYHQTTGLAVWLYMGPTKVAMLRAYYRSVERERRRKRQWPKVQQRRQANIRHLLDECIAALPMIGDLTREQREAIKTLRRMADTPPEFNSPLLEYDRERRHQRALLLRRQRYWKDAEYRRQNKERLRQRRLRMKQQPPSPHE